MAGHSIALFRFMRIMISTAILIHSNAAFAAGCDIFMNQGRIGGAADNAPLGGVMELLAQKTGYTVFMDKRLDTAAVTFSIPDGVSPDSAIRRIVRPHGYAITYVKDGQSCRIQDIRIFKTESGPAGADYRKFAYEKPASSGSVSAIPVSPSTLSNARGKPAGSISPKDLIKAGPAIQKDMFGAPGMKLRPSDKRPDIRPSLREMRTARQKFGAVKNAYQERKSRIRRKQVRINAENHKEIHMRQRNQSIKRMLNVMKSRKTER